MTNRLRALADAFDVELRDMSRDERADLAAVEARLVVWLMDVQALRYERGARWTSMGGAARVRRNL